MICHPVEWYVDRLRRGEPTVSLLYGDGEFQVITGQMREGEHTHYRERITPELTQSMRESLAVRGDDIVRGTDPNLINYQEYGGRDFRGLHDIGQRIESYLRTIKKVDWVDGVVWDRASREGKLGPLLGWCRESEPVLVANKRLVDALSSVFRPRLAVIIPDRDSASYLPDYARAIKELEGNYCVIACMGLGAIPLAMMLRGSTSFLDLGSALDIFAKIGEERGWRSELYQDEERWKETIAKHLYPFW